VAVGASPGGWVPRRPTAPGSARAALEGSGVALPVRGPARLPPDRLVSAPARQSTEAGAAVCLAGTLTPAPGSAWAPASSDPLPGDERAGAAGGHSVPPDPARSPP
jgi:hypothetical protein